MFSGIVEAMATIFAINTMSDAKQFIIKRPSIFTELMIGESIAVNGICLTVTHFDEETFSVTAVSETLSRTNLNTSVNGDSVNLERAMRLDSRLGGHFVQGHIDACGTIISCDQNQGIGSLLKVAYPKELASYIVVKGFIALDGMSVTIVQVTDAWFTIALIPHTLQTTISQHYVANKLINIEVDMIAKYIEKMVGVYSDAR